MSVDSARVEEARRRAGDRRRRQRARLRPLAWVAIAIVVVPAAFDHPAPSLNGRGLGVTLALVAYAAAVAATIARDRRDLLPPLAAGAAGVALAALQPHAFVEVAPSVAVWIAVARLPLRRAVPLAVAVVVALDAVIAATGPHVGQSVGASTLLAAVLAASAHFMRQATESRDEVELLLAQLEDARDAEREAAAVAERSRIARELHDVLAHSLSALAIQLEGARLLARRERVAPALEQALARTGELAKAGLADARHAVSALRGQDTPAVDDLPRLVQQFRELDLDVALEVDGDPRPLAADASLALYRAAQEALTNASRYARGARVTVTLRYRPDGVELAVEDRGEEREPALVGAGGGKGLSGMRERVEALGGRVRAGGTGAGFRVEVEVPA